MLHLKFLLNAAHATLMPALFGQRMADQTEICGNYLGPLVCSKTHNIPLFVILPLSSDERNRVSRIHSGISLSRVLRQRKGLMLRGDQMSGQDSGRRTAPSAVAPGSCTECSQKTSQLNSRNLFWKSLLCSPQSFESVRNRIQKECGKHAILVRLGFDSVTARCRCLQMCSILAMLGYFFQRSKHLRVRWEIYSKDEEDVEIRNFKGEHDNKTGELSYHVCSCNASYVHWQNQTTQNLPLIRNLRHTVFNTSCIRYIILHARTHNTKKNCYTLPLCLCSD